MAIRKFQRQYGGGATVYKCQVCGRKTRNTGDEGQTGNCRQCFDLAGIDNSLNDNCGNDYADPAGVDMFRAYENEIEACIAEIVAKGGDASEWTKAGATYVADWRIAMATPAPVVVEATPAPSVTVTPVTTTTAPTGTNAEWLTINALRLAAASWRETAAFAPSLADQFNGQAISALALADAIEAGTARLVTGGGQ